VAAAVHVLQNNGGRVTLSPPIKSAPPKGRTMADQETVHDDTYQVHDLGQDTVAACPAAVGNRRISGSAATGDPRAGKAATT
jgi:hypothetical protein